MGYYLQRLTRAAWARGVRERSRVWLLVGLALSVTRILLRAISEPEGRAAVTVGPGEAFEIRVVDPPAR